MVYHGTKIDNSDRNHIHSQKEKSEKIFVRQVTNDENCEGFLDSVNTDWKNAMWRLAFWESVTRWGRWNKRFFPYELHTERINKCRITMKDWEWDINTNIEPKEPIKKQSSLSKGMNRQWIFSNIRQRMQKSDKNE